MIMKWKPVHRIAQGDYWGEMWLKVQCPVIMSDSISVDWCWCSEGRSSLQRAELREQRTGPGAGQLAGV